MKSAIIVDSVGYLPQNLQSLPNIYKVDLTVNFSDGSVMTDTNDEEELKTFYNRLSNESQLPTTSQPAVGDYYALMDKIVAEGYETVYCIHLSSGISGTYQSALMVTGEYQDKIKAFCIDSKGASVGMEGIVRAALSLIETDEEPSLAAEKLQWLADNIRIYLMVEDLTNLVKGGRLSATSAFLGSVLQIRPLLYFDAEGKIVLFEKIRSNKRVYKRWVELADQAKKQYPLGIEFAIAHADVIEEAHEVDMLVKETHPDLDSHISALGPVVGTHTGRGAKGFAIIPDLKNYNS